MRRQVMREHGRRCARLGWIDIHIGLSPSGVGERILLAVTPLRRWHGRKPGGVGRTMKRQTRDAFYTYTVEWKKRVTERAVDAAWRVVAGLG